LFLYASATTAARLGISAKGKYLNQYNFADSIVSFFKTIHLSFS
jgi:hypothetical protein